MDPGGELALASCCNSVVRAAFSACCFFLTSCSADLRSSRVTPCVERRGARVVATVGQILRTAGTEVWTLFRDPLLRGQLPPFWVMRRRTSTVSIVTGVERSAPREQG